ncbi:MAG: hypothetical protein K2K83_01195 [Rikenella sp.]|nr:hypothetical protein [Rikenella sp.]
MSNTLIYLLFILGGGAAIAGTIYDLTRGHRNLREAEREARRMNRTQKFTR